MGRLFRNIHPSLQCSSRSLIHEFSYDFFFFLFSFSPHVYILHYASFPWSQCAQFSFLGFSQLNISEPELIFIYHGQRKEGVSLFVHTYTHFRSYYNMIYSFSFDLPAVMLFYSAQNINNS